MAARNKSGTIPKMEFHEVRFWEILFGIQRFKRCETACQILLLNALIANYLFSGGKKSLGSNEKPSRVACECCSTAPTAATRQE